MKNFADRLRKAAEDMDWCGCNDNYVRDVWNGAIKEVEAVANELEKMREEHSADED